MVMLKILILTLLIIWSSNIANATTINLITASELAGVSGAHGTERLWSASIIYDTTVGRYKLWCVTGPSTTYPNNWWSMYYSESTSLTGWTNTNLQEILYGKGHPIWWACETPGKISVLKESDTSYKMWYSIYWCTTHGPWENWIHYRHSTDGINWGSEQTVLNPPSPPPYSDDCFPTAVHLRDGSERIYYLHQHGDTPNWTFRRIDVANDGTTWSNMTTISSIYRYHVYAASIIGDPNGDFTHRLWAIKNNQLCSFESNDEGQTWKETYWGTYTGDEIVGSYYDVGSGIEYFIKKTSDERTLYLSPTPVPEPTSLLLFGIGLAGLGWYKRRKV